MTARELAGLLHAFADQQRSLEAEGLLHGAADVIQRKAKEWEALVVGSTEASDA